MVLEPRTDNNLIFGVLDAEMSNDSGYIKGNIEKFAPPYHFRKCYFGPRMVEMRHMSEIQVTFIVIKSLF
jgi:hypothetical protein